MNGVVVLGAAPTHRQESAAAVRRAAARATRRLVTRQSALLAALDAVVDLEASDAMAVGWGADFRRDGISLELDALVATSDGGVGAIGCMRDTQHPVLLAAAAREHGTVGILTGDAAVRFARSVGFPATDPKTAAARQRLHARRKPLVVREEWQALDVHAALLAPEADEGVPAVAAIARDAAGRFALAASGGGLGLTAGELSPVAMSGVSSFVGTEGALFIIGPREVLVRRAAARLGYSFIAEGMRAKEACDALLAALPEPGRYAAIALSVSEAGVARRGNAYPSAVVTI